jgi:hypothetical protein
MPIKTDIDKQVNLTVYTVKGEVSLDEILNSLEGFYESAEVTLNVLWDGRNAKLKPLSLVDVAKIAGYRNRHKSHRAARRGGKTAIVAPEHVDSGVFSMAEMFKKTMAAKLPYKVRAFRSIDDAVTWLDEG